MVYLDTSVLVPLFLLEPASAEVAARIAALPAGEAAISDWSLVEFASAMGVNARAGRIAAATGKAAVSAMVRMAAGTRVVSLERSDFALARSWVSAFGTGLRGGDALHLAAVRRTRSRLYTLDRLLAAAARRFGVALDH